MTRRAAIAALALAAVGARDAHAEWVTEVVTNRIDYLGVPYLESDGNSWIMTEVPTGTAYYEIDFLSKTFTGSPEMEVWGVWNTLHWNTWANKNESTLNLISGTRAANQRVKMGKTLNGTDTVKIGIFAWYGGGWKTTGVQIFNYKVTRNGVDELNFLPVVVKGVGCMYNKPNGKLYKNSGGGRFIYGSTTGVVDYVFEITTNRVYRAPAPMRSFDAAHPFNNAAARTRLGGTGNGEDGTTLRPSAHFAIKKNEEE